MSTIAKGEITLSQVNDAYTVSITPASCIVKADFDGSNPQLDNAKAQITVKRGALEIPFQITGVATSSPAIKVQYSIGEVSEASVSLIDIDTSLLNGRLDIALQTLDGFKYTTTIRLDFNVVRESTMLDWIQDWEGSKTKVGGTYIMTPKLFVGKKEDIVAEVDGVPIWKEGALTGVYIGPDLLSSGTSSVGIYGYLKDAEIFHLNAEGGYMGGWTFNASGLKSDTGAVNILSEGSIYAQGPNTIAPYWGLYADGHAVFAHGNVKFQANGDAEFAGTITAKSGTVGGWTITDNQLHNKRFIIDSKHCYLGINALGLQKIDAETGDFVFPIKVEDGLKIWFTSASDYGMTAWSSGEKVFQLGSTNQIAGWNLNHQAIWSGSTTPALTQGAYTDSADSLTLAPNGIRSYKWYVDADGTASFVGGMVKFNADNAEMFGWQMRIGGFSTKHVALVSETTDSGVYLSVADISEISGSRLRNTIRNNGGIYMYSDGANSIMRAYDTAGHLGFFLSTSGYNTIGQWSFDHTSIYAGSQNLNAQGFTSDANAIVLGINGLIGNMWKLLADGSGAVAGGNIAWTADGKVTFSDQVTLSWSSITNGPNLTKIDADGIYTGTISANNITAGTISTASIKSEGKWALNTNGSGFLASKNIEWDEAGNIEVRGSFSQDIHYAYKCDATVLSITENSPADLVEIKINQHRYIATNALDNADIIYDGVDATSAWPYQIELLNKYTVVLPNDPKLIGQEVTIYDGYVPHGRATWIDTTIKVEGDQFFCTKDAFTNDTTTLNFWQSISIQCGYASFVCIPDSAGGCMWICKNFYGAICYGTNSKGETKIF